MQAFQLPMHPHQQEDLMTWAISKSRVQEGQPIYLLISSSSYLSKNFQVSPDFIVVREVSIVHQDSFSDALQPYSLDDLANPGCAKIIAKSISKASEQTRQLLKARGQEEAFLDCQMNAIGTRLPCAPNGLGSGKEPATSSPVVKSMPAFGSLVSICQLWQIWDKGNEMAKGDPIEVFKDIAKRGLGFERKRFHEGETVAIEVEHLSKDKDGDCIAAARLLETERQRLNLRLLNLSRNSSCPGCQRENVHLTLDKVLALLSGFPNLALFKSVNAEQ